MDAGGQGGRGFTLEELAQFDGKEGRPAYIAYEGRVYDVTASKLWRNGVHVKQHSAGSELTAAMPAAPHDATVMEKVPCIGVVVEPEVPEPKPPWPLSLSLDNHLHPVAVHFPIAMGVVAPLFALASLLPQFAASFGMLQAVAFWMWAVCALGSIPAFLTGVVSWYYNYRARMSPIYWAKWSYSVLLILLGIATWLVFAYGLHYQLPTAAGGTAFWTYTVLLCLHAPTVLILGWYGGKITFPSG
jgi:predicted heme/steroid binding protein/uncharacterized membrane protein